MNDIIILTEKMEEGEKLRRQLTSFNVNFASVPCYIKKDIIADAGNTHECEYVFSTWYMPKFTEDEVRTLFPKLRAIYYAAGTVKYFAEPFLKKGVRVFTAASANSIPVGEFTASQIILANKGYFQAQKEIKSFLWKFGFKKGRGIAERKNGNYQAKVGIIGCGAIGSKVVELLAPYKLSIMVYDPYLSNERASSLNVQRTSIEELFAQCDVISNHLPDIPETRGLIDYRLLSRMKPAATFINTGRGQQVNEKDLARVLRKNRDMCALLDVTINEPPIPWSPLYRCRNVFLTPHIAGSLSNEYGRMVEYMVQAYNDTLNGISNPCETNLEVIAKQSTR